MLTIELVVTEMCNLHCKYCYMVKRDSRMTMDDIEYFKDVLPVLLQLYNTNTYTISYFGGEPLLNFEFIKQFDKVIKQDDRCVNRVLITNGTLLTDSVVSYIQHENIGVSLSFDGPILQELQRPGSSYTYLLNYLKKYKSGAKVMVAPYSLDRLLETFKWFIDNNLTPDLSLVRDDIWSSDDVDKFKALNKELADLVIFYLKHGSYKAFCGWFRLFFLDIIAYKKYGKRNFACFAGRRGVAIFPKRRVYPCARFGSLDSHKLIDEKKSINTISLEWFQSDKFNPKENIECQLCELYNYCNMGCVWSQLHYHHFDYCNPIPEICELYKDIFKNLLYIIDKVGYSEIFKLVNI